jgi:hypothetical protein
MNHNSIKDSSGTLSKFFTPVNLIIAVFLGIFMMTNCSDDVTEPDDIGDLSGVWTLTTTVGSNTCGMEEGSGVTDRIILIQCDNELQIVMGNGIWTTATIRGDHLDFTAIEIETDDTGCQSTRTHTGSLSGSDTELKGTFTTTVTFDTDSCPTQSECTIETTARLILEDNYVKDCLDRGEFGDPSESKFILPWPVGKSYRLNNSYCIPTGGHRLQQAYDFLIPIGDPIIASRAGVVRVIKDDSPDDGQGTDHNHVMIEHEDGSVGFYAHLKQFSVTVQVDQNVEAGETIALAGHSGTTDVVHLHMGVYNNFPPVEGDDRAFIFSNMEGPIDCRGGLVNGATYTAR